MAGGRDAEKISTTDNTAYTTVPRDDPTPANPPAETSPPESQPFLAWVFNDLFLLLAHTICSIALSLTVSLAINGYNAIDTSTPRYFDGKLHLRVSDITTLVSMGLVVNRFFTTSWTTVALSKCIYILKNKTTSELSNQQLSFMEKYRLPPWARYPFRLPRGIWNWIILLILLCILPQQFIAPLISGAVDWNSVSVPGSARISVNSTNPTSSAVLWEQFPSYADTSIAVRQEVISKAQGLASLAWTDSSTTSKNGTSLTGNGCRHVVSNDGLTTNSTLLDSIIPCIRIQNIDWATSASEISGSVANDVFSYASSHLSMINSSLDLHALPGQVVLFNPNLLWNSSKTGLPTPTLVSGPQVLAVSIANEDSTGNCTNMPISLFGDVNNIPQYLYPWFYACHAFANVTITAGVTKSPVSTYLSSNVIEDQTPINQVTFEPNLWVQEALWLLPDLMSQLALGNASQVPTWNNLDAYVGFIIRQAYLAAWDSLHQTFDDSTVTNSTISVAIPAVPRIQASVSNARVFAWLGVSLLVTVGGLLLNRLPLPVPGPDGEVREEIKNQGKDDGKELLDNVISAVIPD